MYASNVYSGIGHKSFDEISFLKGYGGSGGAGGGGGASGGGGAGGGGGDR